MPGSEDGIDLKSVNGSAGAGTAAKTTEMPPEFLQWTQQVAKGLQIPLSGQAKFAEGMATILGLAIGGTSAYVMEPLGEAFGTKVINWFKITNETAQDATRDFFGATSVTPMVALGAINTQDTFEAGVKHFTRPAPLSDKSITQPESCCLRFFRGLFGFATPFSAIPQSTLTWNYISPSSKARIPVTATAVIGPTLFNGRAGQTVLNNTKSVDKKTLLLQNRILATINAISKMPPDEFGKLLKQFFPKTNTANPNESQKTEGVKTAAASPTVDQKAPAPPPATVDQKTEQNLNAKNLKLLFNPMLLQQSTYSLQLFYCEPPADNIIEDNKIYLYIRKSSAGSIIEYALKNKQGYIEKGIFDPEELGAFKYLIPNALNDPQKAQTLSPEAKDFLFQIIAKRRTNQKKPEPFKNENNKRKTTSYLGFILGALASVIYYDLTVEGDKEPLGIEASWFQISSGILAYTLCAALTAVNTQLRFEGIYDWFAGNKEENHTIWQKIRKTIWGLSIFFGVFAAVPLTDLQIDEASNGSIIQILLILPVFLGPFCVRSKALESILNRALDAVIKIGSSCATVSESKQAQQLIVELGIAIHAKLPELKPEILEKIFAAVEETQPSQETHLNVSPKPPVDTSDSERIEDTMSRPLLKTVVKQQTSARTMCVIS